MDARLHHRVHVEIILDHSNEKDAHSDLPWLLEQKLEPLIDTHHAIAHNKVILIDGKTILTGSFNFTQQAESHNAENLVVIKGHPELVSSYRFDFDHHKKHSRKPETGGVAASPAADHHHGRGAAKSDQQDDAGGPSLAATFCRRARKAAASLSCANVHPAGRGSCTRGGRRSTASTTTPPARPPEPQHRPDCASGTVPRPGSRIFSRQTTEARQPRTAVSCTIDGLESHD